MSLRTRSSSLAIAFTRALPAKSVAGGRPRAGRSRGSARSAVRRRRRQLAQCRALRHLCLSNRATPALCPACRTRRLGPSQLSVGDVGDYLHEHPHGRSSSAFGGCSRRARQRGRRVHRCVRAPSAPRRYKFLRNRPAVSIPPHRSPVTRERRLRRPASALRPGPAGQRHPASRGPRPRSAVLSAVPPI